MGSLSTLFLGCRSKARWRSRHCYVQGLRILAADNTLLIDYLIFYGSQNVTFLKYISLLIYFFSTFRQRNYFLRWLIYRQCPPAASSLPAGCGCASSKDGRTHQCRCLLVPDGAIRAGTWVALFLTADGAIRLAHQGSPFRGCHMAGTS